LKDIEQVKTNKMNQRKAKRLRKQWLKMPESKDIKYNIKGRVIEGITFRQLKKHGQFNTQTIN